MKAKLFMLKVTKVVAKVNRPFWALVAIACNVGCIIEWFANGCSAMSIILGCMWFTVAPVLFAWYVGMQNEELMQDIERSIYEENNKNKK